MNLFLVLVFLGPQFSRTNPFLTIFAFCLHEDLAEHWQIGFSFIFLNKQALHKVFQMIKHVLNKTMGIN